jgi:hypothetical protein
VRIFASILALTLIAAGCGGGASSPIGSSAAAAPDPTGTPASAEPAQRTIPPDWFAAICDSRELLAGADGIPSRAAIDEALDLLDAAEDWRPGEPTRRALQEAWEQYSTAERLEQEGDTMGSLDAAIAALNGLIASVDAAEALAAAYDRDELCPGSSGASSLPPATASPRPTRTAAARDLQVVETGYTLIDDYIQYAVVIENPNARGWVADFIDVTVALTTRTATYGQRG